MIERISERTWRETIPADDVSMRRAREFVTAVIETRGEPVNEDIILLTSEAVTNSYLHADTATVSVQVTLSDTVARVAVHDDDPEPPVVRSTPGDETGGFGMRLIEALAQDWGVIDVLNDGKIVWFEVELPEHTPGSTTPVAPAA